MSLLGWRQWAVDRDGLLRPAWTPWSPFPAGLLLWRPDGLTNAYCLRDTHPPIGLGSSHVTAVGLPRRPVPDGPATGPDAATAPSAATATADAAGNARGTGTTRGTGTAGGTAMTGGSATSRDSARSAGATPAGISPLPGAQERPGGGSGIPAEGCACGLYAWRDPEALAAAPVPRWTRRPIVVGVARLGGRIIIGERGYRAELGYPVAVHDPAGVIAPAYQVARYREWPALVAEWRPDQPSEAA
jgi:hypothetical protein